MKERRDPECLKRAEAWRLTVPEDGRVRIQGRGIERWSHRLHLELQVVLLLQQGHHLLLQLLAPSLRLLQCLFDSPKLLLHGGHLLLSLCALQ